MAAVTRGFCRSMMTFSKHKSLKNLDRVCARFMGQHTRAVMPTIKNKESARAFVLHLDDRARVLLKDQLHEIEKREVLDYLHEEIDQIEAGIRAAHEEVPEEEKKKKIKVSRQELWEGGPIPVEVEVPEEEKKKKIKVSRQELWEVAVYNGFPFIGFGFLDNLIMIVAGEWIDMSLGVALGISTMAAAGLGNLVSDVAGVASAGYVESISSKIGVKTPDLTKEQAHQWQTKWATALGRTWGISIGCLLGMFPLLFFPSKEEKEQRKEEEKEEKRKAEENAKKNSSPQAHHHVYWSEEDKTPSSSSSSSSSSTSLPPASETQSSTSQGSLVSTQGIISTGKKS